MTIHTRLTLLALLLAPCFAFAQFDNLSAGGSLSTDDLLRVDWAFRSQALGSDESIDVLWIVEPGYYLYRKQFRVFINGEEISQLNLPAGEKAYDPLFDEELEIYRDEVLLNFSGQESGQINIRFQGCADAGYCYPPSWVAFERSADSDSVTYLGLVDGPDEPPVQDSTSARIYLYNAFALVLFAGFFWLGMRKSSNRIQTRN